MMEMKILSRFFMEFASRSSLILNVWNNVETGSIFVKKFKLFGSKMKVVVCVWKGRWFEIKNCEYC